MTFLNIFARVVSSPSDVVSLPGLRPLDGVAGTGAPPKVSF